MYNKKFQKNDKKFCCLICDYSTSRKSQYERHIATLKHKNNENTTNNTTNTTLKKKHYCECGKVYEHRASLYNHKQRCTYGKELNTELLVPKVPKISSDKLIELMNENNEIKNCLIKENQELRKTISEIIPKIGNTTNKTKFNINLFLNEKCKDALSIEQFLEKIEISMKNLVTTIDKGNIEGLSNIIMENMNKLSLYERPMHCTDIKRETLYIKNEDEWKRDNDKSGINNAIKSIENKQLKNIQIWLDKHPNWENNSKEQEEYMKLIKNSTSTLDDTGEKDKFYKKICNELYIGDSNNI
jgi:hypothetical protein